jgi:hypothetical protein
MEAEFLSTYFKPGDYVKIIKDINCIPSGTYQVSDIDSGMIHFTVGNSVTFCVSNDAVELFAPIPKTKGIIKRTSLTSFLDRYYALLSQNKNKPFSPFDPITMCAISNSVAREIH